MGGAPSKRSQEKFRYGKEGGDRSPLRSDICDKRKEGIPGRLDKAPWEKKGQWYRGTRKNPLSRGEEVPECRTGNSMRKKKSREVGQQEGADKRK